MEYSLFVERFALGEINFDGETMGQKGELYSWMRNIINERDMVLRQQIEQLRADNQDAYIFTARGLNRI